MEFVLHVFSLFAAFTGIFSESIKDRFGVKGARIISIIAVIIAFGILSVQVFISKSNEDAAEKRSYEIAKIINSSDSIIVMSNDLSAQLAEASVYVVEARDRAKSLSNEINKSINNNNLKINSFVDESLSKTQLSLEKVVVETQNTINRDLSKSTFKLSQEIEKSASPDEIKKLIAASIENKLKKIELDMEKLAREIKSTTMNIEKQNNEVDKMFSNNGNRLSKELSEIKTDNRKEFDKQSSSIKSIAQVTESNAKKLYEISRLVNDLSREIQNIKRSLK